MRLTECRAFIEREVSFPVDHESLIDRIGDRSIEAPSGEPESIAEVLERAGEPSYRSPGEVHATLLGNLGDAYVGRKYYDDRGANHHAYETLSF